MSRYETYKPSGIDWIGEVPKHWQVKRLKDVANVTLGKMLQNDDSGADDLKPYLRSFNVQWDRVDLSEVKEMWLSEYEQEQYRLKKYDLVVSEGGEVGRCAIWLDEIEECYIQNSVHKVTCNKRILPYFLLFQFTTAGKAGHFDKIINKVSIGHLTREKLVAVNFVLPPKTEQLAIANYLDDQTQKIDRLIANKKAQAEKLKELRQIEINHAVTKGLNPNAEMKDSGIEWLGEIPKHWGVKRLKNVADINSTKQELKFEEVKDLEVVFLAMESVSENGEIDNSEKRPISELWEGFTYFKKNDVIIAKITPCFENGKGAWLNRLESEFGFGSTEFHTVRGHKSRLDNHYFYHVTKSDVFMKTGEAFMTGSAGQKRVSTNFVLTFKLAFPPIEEQIQIANYLQQRTTAIDQLIKNIEAQIEKLQELRKIKIYEAVTGKIKVSGYERT